MFTYIVQIWVKIYFSFYLKGRLRQRRRRRSHIRWVTPQMSKELFAGLPRGRRGPGPGPSSLRSQARSNKLALEMQQPGLLLASIRGASTTGRGLVLPLHGADPLNCFFKKKHIYFRQLSMHYFRVYSDTDLSKTYFSLYSGTTFYHLLGERASRRAIIPVFEAVGLCYPVSAWVRVCVLECAVLLPLHALCPVFSVTLALALTSLPHFEVR